MYSDKYISLNSRNFIYFKINPISKNEIQKTRYFFKYTKLGGRQ